MYLQKISNFFDHPYLSSFPAAQSAAAKNPTIAPTNIPPMKFIFKHLLLFYNFRVVVVGVVALSVLSIYFSIFYFST